MIQAVCNVCQGPHSRIPVLLAVGRRRTRPEAILEAPRQRLEVLAAPRASGLAALDLQTPIVLPDLRPRVAAVRARLLLDVEGPLAAADAELVRLLVALTHRWRAVARAREAQHQVQRGLLLDVVIRERATILQLLPCEDEALL